MDFKFLPPHVLWRCGFHTEISPYAYHLQPSVVETKFDFIDYNDSIIAVMKMLFEYFQFSLNRCLRVIIDHRVGELSIVVFSLLEI